MICRGFTTDGQLVRLMVREAAHEYLNTTVVKPAQELGEELERHKRQKKDGIDPQELVIDVDADGDHNAEAEDDDGEARAEGDCRPPSTRTGALFCNRFEEKVTQPACGIYPPGLSPPQ
eukprot:342775-Prorocentrum_minimum.AAC.1